MITVTYCLQERGASLEERLCLHEASCKEENNRILQRLEHDGTRPNSVMKSSGNQEIRSVKSSGPPGDIAIDFFILCLRVNLHIH